MFTHKLSILLAFAILFGFSPAWAGKDKSSISSEETPQCVLNVLRAWSVERKELKDPPEPSSIEKLTINPKIAAQYYRTALDDFRTYWNPDVIKELKAIAEEGKAGNITAEASKSVYAKLKAVRSPMKTLRFLFFALGEGHDAPVALDNLTKAIGKSGDVLSGRAAQAELKGASKRVLDALTPDKVEALDRALASFKPTTQEDFDKWFSKTAKEAKKILSEKKGAPEEFHQGRKDLQAILSVYQMKMALNSEDPELKKLVNYLWRRTEDIGDEHEVFEKNDAKGKLNYHKDVIKFPRDICDESLAFLKRLKQVQLH